MLIPYDVTINREGMRIHPIFADTPRRQRMVKDPKRLRGRVNRLPSHAAGRAPGGPEDLLKEMNREDHERVQRGERPSSPDISERDLSRYFRTRRVDPGPFQLKFQRREEKDQIKKRRIHFAKLDLYLDVFDRCEKGESFAKICRDLRIRGLRITGRRCQQIWETALRGTGETFDGWMTLHLPGCLVCAKAARARLRDARYCRETILRIRGLGSEPLMPEVIRRLLESRTGFTAENKAQIEKYANTLTAKALRGFLLSGSVSGTPFLDKRDAKTVDLLAARKDGILPAKRAENEGSDRQWKLTEIRPSLFSTTRR